MRYCEIRVHFRSSSGPILTFASRTRRQVGSDCQIRSTSGLPQCWVAVRRT